MIVNPWRFKLVHRLFVYTEHGLYPWLVEKFLSMARGIGCRFIVDPFIGSGVVAVEAQRMGFNVVGIDSNPWSLVVTRAKTTKLDFNNLLEKVNVLRDSDSLEPYIPSNRLEAYHPRDILHRLGVIRRFIEDFSGPEKNLLLTVFGGVVERYSYLKRTPAPELSRGKLPKEDPVEYFLGEFIRAINDLGSHSFNGVVVTIWADSTMWLPERICCLLTSPPFTNNVDYIRHTQLQLLWSGLARDSNDLGYLRDLQIPACVATARSWKMEYLNRDLIKIMEAIKGKMAKGYRKYLKQYFYYMRRHFELLYERLEGEAWYTIGDSFLGNAYVPTHKLLMKIAMDIGFRTDLERIGSRKHFSKELGLYLLRLYIKN